MKTFLLIFLGGGLGSITRFTLGRWTDSLHQHVFPFGTFVVNIIACFTLGIIVGLADHKQLVSPSTRLFLATGFCGGFSTFSTFSYETLRLLQQGAVVYALLYVALSVVVCLAAVGLGVYVVKV